MNIKSLFFVNVVRAIALLATVTCYLLPVTSFADGFRDGGGFGERQPRAERREQRREIRNTWDDAFIQPTVRNQTSADIMNSRGAHSPGEWNWWGLAEMQEYRFTREFWDPNVDYRYFERKTNREILDRQGLIRTDTRSCPMNDTLACRQWLAQPRRVERLPDAIGFTEEDIEFSQTFGNEEIEEMFRDREARREALTPSNWQFTYQETTWMAHPEYQNCPFEHEFECQIWLTKPVVRVTTGSRNLGSPNINKMIVLMRAGNGFSATAPTAKPLLNRYRALQSLATACCTSGLTHSLESAGASQALVYRFLIDDANFYQFGERCMMVHDWELDMLENRAMAYAVGDVRNTCLCRHREYLEALLAPFVEIYNAHPPFAQDDFMWSYRDGLNRCVTVAINREVQFVLWQLRQCP